MAFAGVGSTNVSAHIQIPDRAAAPGEKPRSERQQRPFI